MFCLVDWASTTWPSGGSPLPITTSVCVQPTPDLLWFPPSYRIDTYLLRPVSAAPVAFLCSRGFTLTELPFAGTQRQTAIIPSHLIHPYPAIFPSLPYTSLPCTYPTHDVPRSSQPMVGVTTAACPEDEALLMTIRACAFGTQDEEGDPW